VISVNSQGVGWKCLHRARCFCTNCRTICYLLCELYFATKGRKICRLCDLLKTQRHKYPLTGDNQVQVSSSIVIAADSYGTPSPTCVWRDH